MMELEGVEGRETENVEVGLVRELEGCRNKCKELEGRSKIAEERCMVLESEIEKRESEFTVLAVEKIEIEDEVKVLKRRNAELEKRISEVENGNKVDGEVVVMTEEKDEEEEVFQLMIENKVLECEKKRAESEVEDWKLKCGKLELRVLELEKENLVLRGKQSPLAGMMKTQLTNKASDPYNGSDVVTRSEHLETKNQKLANNNETLLDPSRTSSTCSPLKGIGDLQAAVTPLIDQPSNQSTTQVEGRKRGFLSETEMDCGSHVRKQLMFGEEGSLSKKIAPLTPVGARPLTFGIIDISDSEDELGDTVGNETQKTCDVNLKRTLFDQSDEEDMNSYKRNAPFISTPKRKRASNIVTTDSESDDDNVPICKFKTKRLQELNQGAMHSYLNGCSVTSAVSEEKVRESATPRRRLVALRDCKVKEGPPKQNSPGNSNNGGANYHFGIPTTKGVENDEMEDDGSAADTEGESLGGFIVSSSDDSDGDDGSIASEDVSDGNVDYGEVISRIRRNRNHKLKWEFEADMLAAFGKDPELCMKAVCALYRQQTSEEKYSKGTIYSNQRGFSQCDAFRGTTLAEFLTDGDPKGDVIKSVEELQAFDPKGPELCRTLATHYSKQLFAIYKNKEDPFFLPS